MDLSVDHDSATFWDQKQQSKSAPYPRQLCSAARIMIYDPGCRSRGNESKRERKGRKRHETMVQGAEGYVGGRVVGNDRGDW